MTQNEVLRAVTNWRFGVRRLEQIEEQLIVKQYRITPTLSLDGGVCGGGFHSKVEDFCMARLDLEVEKKNILSQQAAIMNAKQSCELTDVESSVIEYLMIGGKLSEYSRINGVYISYVYKIRDRAIMKIFKTISKCSDITRFAW